MTPSFSTGEVEPRRSERRHWIELPDVNWLIVFLLYTCGATVSALTVYTADLAEGSSRPLFYPVIWEFTGYFAAFVLTPVIVLAFSRVPIRRNNWQWAVPVHILISVALGIVHTLMMLGSRQAIYDLLNLGHYDYGAMGYRFIMEYTKQFLHYWFFGAMLLAYGFYRDGREREKRAAELELRASELQRQLGHAQLQALRSQLNPHFLFNTLNMVSSVMYENVSRADEMIAALSRMLRMSLQENVGAMVPVRRELEFVQCAADLIKARFQDRVVIQIDCQLKCLDQLIPNMLVHTLVENAIKHNDRGRDQVMRVEARIEQTGAMLDISVTDNGPGIDDLEKAMGNGVGLKNTRQRLVAMYGDRHRFIIENRPDGGLAVRVAIPLNTPAAPETNNHHNSNATTGVNH